MKKRPVVHVDILSKPHRLSPKPNEGYLGQIDYVKRVIFVAPDISLDEGVDTLFHEALHGISFHLDLKLSEHKVKLLEAGVLQFLRANGVKLTPLKTLIQKSRKG